MSIDHQNEPREVGYSLDHKDIYKDWTGSKKLNSIFAGTTQADLFFFAMALGHNREKASEIKKNKLNNVPISALNEEQKWGIIAAIVDEGKDLAVLKDEKPIYSEAEKYANEGIQILSSHIDKQGPNYPKYLEAELRGILSDED